MQSGTVQIHCFVSYSQADRRWVDEKVGGDRALVPWLARQLEGENVHFWYDPKLHEHPGVEFQPVIEREIDESPAAILLLSQDFATSKFINEVELPRIRERVQAGEMELIPILVAPTSFNSEHMRWVSARQIIPSAMSPLINFVSDDAQWVNARQDILEAVANTIRRLSDGQYPQSTAPAVGQHLVITAAPHHPKPRKTRIMLPAIAASVIVVVLLVSLATPAFRGHRRDDAAAGNILPAPVKPQPPAVTYTYPDLYDYLERIWYNKQATYARWMTYSDISDLLVRGKQGKIRIYAPLTVSREPTDIVIADGKWYARAVPREEASQEELTASGVSRETDGFFVLPERLLAEISLPQLRLLPPVDNRARLVGNFKCQVQEKQPVGHVTLVCEIPAPDDARLSSQKAYHHFTGNALPDGWADIDILLPEGVSMAHGFRLYLIAIVLADHAGFYQVSNELLIDAREVRRDSAGVGEEDRIKPR